MLWLLKLRKKRAWLRQHKATLDEWSERPMRPDPLVRDMDEEVPASFHAYDEKIRDLFEQHCREIIENASKSLEEHRQSLAKSLASPVKVWHFRAWMERRFDDDLDRCWISYEDTRIRKAMLALSEKELSKT